MEKNTSSQPAAHDGLGAVQRSSKRRKQLTFALIGCSAFLGLLVLLTPVVATMLVPKLVEELNDAKRARAALDSAMLLAAIGKYAADTGAPPATLDQLLEVGPSGEPYVVSKVLVDPWKNAYVYFPPTDGAAARIVSYGADGQPGGENDDADIDSADQQR